jgi:hypothetical protein
MRLALLAALVVTSCGPEAARSPDTTPRPPLPSVTATAGFDADSAWAYLVRQVEFGPRVPGSSAHRECGEWLAATLERAGAVVERDTFSYRDPEGTEWPLVNILGRFGSQEDGRLLLVAHWDARPWSDQDPDPARRSEPVIGANDGASGVAVLLEVARGLGSADLPRGVDILFADGEDLGQPQNQDGYCRGTRRFAGRGLGRYWRAIVVDLVGDRDLNLPVEQHSLQGAPEVVDWIWTRGGELSPEAFSTDIGPAVFDDHVPLLDAGLPAVDIIDFDYAAWHTRDDDLSAVSRQSLAAVGRVVLSLALHP